MTAVTGKRQPGPRRLCIFCGGTPISKEHIYADWMRDYLIPFESTSHRVTFSSRNAASGKMQLIRDENGPNALKGDHRARGMRVVCQGCNNGWMSQIQSCAKPTLLPLLQGKRYVPNREQQRRIAAWAVMFTMVYEFADKPTMTVDTAQREHFRRHMRPPKNWMVWVASFSGFAHSGTAFHRGLGIIKPEHSEDAVPNECNAQLTIGAAGAFCFLTFYTSQDFILDKGGSRLRLMCAKLGLRRVWPPVGGNQRGDAVIDDDAFIRLMDLATHALIS